MTYDVAVIGGGLSGLATAIQMADKGRNVILFEKKTYPFHRVCGEYIAMESWNFLHRLGVDLSALHVPKISKVNISSPSGKMLSHMLNPGGFGISRYKLDHMLAEQAASKGVKLVTGVSVSDLAFSGDQWKVCTSDKIYHAKIAIGAFGKRSNLDIKQNRAHASERKKSTRLTNYIAVKYHVKSDLPSHVIELHNFDQGYCGISKIEEERYCLCYLTTADNLDKSGNNIQNMEKNILSRNPYLNTYFNKLEKIYDKPLIIAQIDFSDKVLVENHLPMVGDAAGLIAPLCGNGMSMALRGSVIISQLLEEYLSDRIDINSLSSTYTKQWKNEFSVRLKAGRVFQSLFGNIYITEGVIRVLQNTPRLLDKLIALTHGKPF